MQIYSKILVAMDSSSVDETILKHVSGLALQNGAELVLLHVIHSHTLDQERTLRENAETSMKKHCDELNRSGIPARYILRSGEPEKEILAEIEGGGYDLVAMATHGHRFFGDFLFGSVSETLKHRIRIPLLLLRGEKR
jgi:universal stress protein A